MPTFLNEPIQRWVLFIIFVVLVLGAWNGIMREMK